MEGLSTIPLRVIHSPLTMEPMPPTPVMMGSSWRVALSGPVGETEAVLKETGMESGQSAVVRINRL